MQAVHRPRRVAVAVIEADIHFIPLRDTALTLGKRLNIPRLRVSDAAVQRHTSGLTIRKVVVVPGKLVNLVVK